MSASFVGCKFCGASNGEECKSPPCKQYTTAVNGPPPTATASNATDQSQVGTPEAAGLLIELSDEFLHRADNAPLIPGAWHGHDFSTGSPWDGWNPDDAFRLGYETAMREAKVLVDSQAIPQADEVAPHSPQSVASPSAPEDEVRLTGFLHDVDHSPPGATQHIVFTPDEASQDESWFNANDPANVEIIIRPTPKEEK